MPASFARVFVVVVTMDRAPELASTLDAVAGQDALPRAVVVVDHSGPGTVGAVDAVVDTARRHLAAVGVPLTHHRPGANLGPAGGRAVGLALLPSAEPGDLVAFLDDDHPWADHRQLGLLVACLQQHPDAAGIGTAGARLDRLGRLGRVAPASATPVDVIHGGASPVYRREALDAVGGFDATFFYGFEELDLGLRLRAAGWTSLAWRAPGSAPHGNPPPNLRLVEHLSPERRYYAVRNLARVFAHHGRWLGLLLGAVLALLLRPVATLVVAPSQALPCMVASWQGALHALTGRSGPRHDARTPRGGVGALWLVLVRSKLQEVRAFTPIGFAGWLLEPLTYVAIYWLLLEVLATADREAPALFLLCALLPWRFFTSVVARSFGVIDGYAAVITNRVFPVGILPAVVVGADAVTMIVSLGLLVPLMVLYGVAPTVQLLWLPVILAGLGLLALGAAYPCALLGVRFRAFTGAAMNVVRVGFFVSTALVSLETVEGWQRAVLLVNPMSAVFEALRSVVVQGAAPPSWALAVPLLAGGVAVLVGGLWFRRTAADLPKRVL